MVSSSKGATPPIEVGNAADWRRLEPTKLTPILSASLDAFYEHGFHGTSVRDIARRVGVTVPALYYHHENKEAVLLALLELSTSDVLERAHAASADGGDDPVQRLANVIEAIVLRMTMRSRLAALESEVRYLSPENRQRYRTVRKGVEELVLEIVKEGKKRELFDVADAAETTRALLGMCQSIPRWYHAEGKLTPDAVARKYVEIAMKTVGSTELPVKPKKRRTADV
ncbi:TetR/AcrR family transcriptional regulator [Rhodococcus sp. ACS1]|uniref:DNA-binding transcriptional regulator, AcrR family n=1 Tax=Rhodococcus koreensis TaxID=99653 RepID=A0A1H4VC89_9NOCA|nr:MULTISPECIES: TetR/AcrR family transcriptional regulator [Rhodococcus]PBC36741.1 TetR/AcrR family transcriptional regulator [Rhodococcus sp. ACS1]QSE81288.1 TetR family transcriptional regulator [Rhodococcus koreensis]SEC78573.1 DNA-binding transcriptional regulator, AcrR family [Rhodococcus koreensis]